MVAAVVALALSGTPAADLRITVWPQGRSGPSRVSTVRCPSAATACRKLASVPWSAFAPVPPQAMCSQIYAGPQEALVVGRFRGRKVWARFSRTDGCQTARWSRLAFLFAE